MANSQSVRVANNDLLSWCHLARAYTVRGATKKTLSYDKVFGSPNWESKEKTTKCCFF